MEAKRFDYSKERTFYYKIGFSKFDVVFIGYFVVLTGLSFYLAQEFPLFPVSDVRD
jgi:energy-coupling factor transport system permease protein